MGILRRLAFYLGLLLGLVSVAVAGTVALTYLLTGKLVSVEMGEEKKPEVTLMTPDEVVALIRRQPWAAAAGPLAEEAGGEGNE
jgi:hypothetical protein